MTAPSDMESMTKEVKVPCDLCDKLLSFTNLRRHKKTVHNTNGKKWTCQVCGQISQTETRLAQHQKQKHQKPKESEVFCCPNCEYRTICRRYLVDHTKLQHTQSGDGQFICSQGSCFTKPTIYPNLARLNKHRSCHQKQTCKTCGKNYATLRNLKRHEKLKHQKEPSDKSKSNENANSEKGILQNPIACMAPKTPNLKRHSSVPKNWNPMTPNTSNEPLDNAFLADPGYSSSWDAAYSEVLSNAVFVHI